LAAIKSKKLIALVIWEFGFFFYFPYSLEPFLEGQPFFLGLSLENLFIFTA